MRIWQKKKKKKKKNVSWDLSSIQDMYMLPYMADRFAMVWGDSTDQSFLKKHLHAMYTINSIIFLNSK